MDHVDEASIVAEDIKKCAQHEVQAGFLHALLAINESLRMIAARMEPMPPLAGLSEHLDVDHVCDGS